MSTSLMAAILSGPCEAPGDLREPRGRPRPQPPPGALPCPLHERYPGTAHACVSDACRLVRLPIAPAPGTPPVATRAAPDTASIESSQVDGDLRTLRERLA